MCQSFVTRLFILNLSLIVLLPVKQFRLKPKSQKKMVIQIVTKRPQCRPSQCAHLLLVGLFVSSSHVRLHFLD